MAPVIFFYRLNRSSSPLLFILNPNLVPGLALISSFVILAACSRATSSVSLGIEGIGLGQLRRVGSEGRLEDFGRSDDADSNWQ